MQDDSLLPPSETSPSMGLPPDAGEPPAQTPDASVESAAKELSLPREEAPPAAHVVPLPSAHVPPTTTPLALRPALVSSAPLPARRSTARPLVTLISWLVAAALVLFGTRYFVPNLAEEIQYAMTRGRLRAEHDDAGRELAGAPLDELARSFQLVSKRVGPSVVHINTVSNEQESVDETTGLIAPGRSRRPSRQGQGSGVVVENDGFILTNYHVIRDSQSITVHLSDGSTRDAVEIGHDVATDLALLKVDADSLIPAEWGESGRMEVGSPVWAVGSPFGLEHSVTFGILSAKNRAGQAGTVYQDFLQTDVAVNPGNSGGPLVDAHGRVIGINTAIVGQTYQGISFAIPSDVARDVYQRLKTERRVARGWLGVLLADVDEERAGLLGLPTAEGAYIEQIVESFGPSPAGRGGIKAGDVIIRFNEVEIDRSATLSQQVGRTQVGASVPVVVFREGKQVEVTIKLGERPEAAH